jgi:hypothetical protein
VEELRDTMDITYQKKKKRDTMDVEIFELNRKLDKQMLVGLFCADVCIVSVAHTPMGGYLGSLSSLFATKFGVEFGMIWLGFDIGIGQVLT